MNVRMVRLSEEHLELVMNWRMRPDITKYMNTDPKLTLDMQKNWYDKIKDDDTQIHWVILMDEKPIGVLNIVDIDRKNSKCSWGYYVAELSARSLKLALNLEWSLYDYVLGDMGLNKLYCETFALNKQVVKLHLMCGSKEDGIMRSHIKKNDEFFDVSISSILKEEWDAKKTELSFERFSFE